MQKILKFSNVLISYVEFSETFTFSDLLTFVSYLQEFS